MSIRFQVPRKALLVRFLFSPFGKFLLVSATVLAIAALGTFTYFYVHYAGLIDEKLAKGPFAKTSRIYSIPQMLAVGDAITIDEIVDQLVRSGYTTSRSNTVGWYNVRPDAVEIFPGSDSYFDKDEPGVVKIRDGQIAQIISLRDNTSRNQYALEPELVTNLFDKKREKRRLVRFADLPKDLVNAVVAVEDKRFFEHAGFDPFRIIKSVWVDVSTGQRAQGASTLTMQLARGLWLTKEKTLQRKAAETLITLHLEQRLTKEQIFEYYANYVPLGRRGSFEIQGFGEAAQAYFGKDVKTLNLEECATLAGVIQLPSYRNPVRWPDRATQRRNIVLSLMLDNGFVDERRYAKAKAAPMVVAKGAAESNDAPYFVDLVNETLQEKFADHDFQERAYRVYTTIDLDLQRDALEAVRVGLAEVDKSVARLFKGKTTKDGKPYEAQTALVALDAETGEIRALVGGRGYGQSQLNHALAKRQPGSIFKPFVYAAALSSGLSDSAELITTSTVYDDEPTVFYYDGRTYEPSNYKDGFYGRVTVRQALAKSLNIPTVKIAEAAGYAKVAETARRAGLSETKATPAAALGAYEATPIDMAGAYTVFANHGTYHKPAWIRTIRDEKGSKIFQAKPETVPVLDPRVNYLMVSLLEEVLRSGTGAGTRGRGFWLPAAGKTGSSRDGWFAGFTSKLICVVWVGFDDNTDIKLEGARSALPIWAEFMKRAHARRAYRTVHPFAPPDGVVAVDQAAENGKRTEYYLAGTEPSDSQGKTQSAGWVASADEADPKPGAEGGDSERPRHVATRRVTPASPPGENAKPAETANKEGAKPAGEKKGFWGRFQAIFK